jgi:hypothetical protein
MKSQFVSGLIASQAKQKVWPRIQNFTIDLPYSLSGKPWLGLQILPTSYAVAMANTQGLMSRMSGDFSDLVATIYSLSQHVAFIRSLPTAT